MTEEQIVKKVCEMMGIRYHHYDNHNMTTQYFGGRLESKPKIVVYSSRYGAWEFAILENMTITTPYGMSANFLLIDILNERLSTVGLKEKEQKYYDELVDMKKGIEESEKFLKENDCASVINNPNKKINWV